MLHSNAKRPASAAREHTMRVGKPARRGCCVDLHTAARNTILIVLRMDPVLAM